MPFTNGYVKKLGTVYRRIWYKYEHMLARKIWSTYTTGWQWRKSTLNTSGNGIYVKSSVDKIKNHQHHLIIWPTYARLQCGTDAISMIHPKASNIHVFILLTIDFTNGSKWLLLRRWDQPHFMKINITCHCGVHHAL